MSSGQDRVPPLESRSPGSSGGDEGASHTVSAGSAGDSAAVAGPYAPEGWIASDWGGDSPQKTTRTAQATAGNALIDAAHVCAKHRRIEQEGGKTGRMICRRIFPPSFLPVNLQTSTNLD
jgi:hypothetical protein